MRAGILGAIWCVVVLALLASIGLVLVTYAQYPPPPQALPISLSELAHGIRGGAIMSIVVTGTNGLATDEFGNQLGFEIGQATNLLHDLSAFGVRPEELARVTVVVGDSSVGTWWPLLVAVTPAVVMGIMVLLAARLGPGPNNEWLAFTTHLATRYADSGNRVRFGDVAGVDEAKLELQELVEFLTMPEKFESVGARTPRGVMLVGPPGTGKTLLARAVAGEADVPFFSISGSEFVEIVVGVGARRVRSLFREAERSAPCIVFVDEIDAIGRQRLVGAGVPNAEREQTLNQILVEMDGFDSTSNVIVLAATNRADMLDPALLRPGRFDRRVTVAPPDVNGRQAILQLHSRSKPLEQDVDLGYIARMTAGFSGADLANAMNEAAILATRRRKMSIGLAELEDAVDRLRGGPEGTTRFAAEADRKRMAYHHSGHTVMMLEIESRPRMRKLSIARLDQCGAYARPPDVEDRCVSRTQLRSALAAYLAGHAAEGLALGEVASGAEDDFARATDVARRMVGQYGMTERIGPVSLANSSPTRGYSERTAEALDAEIRSLLDSAYAQAVDVLTRRRAVLERMAAALVQHETLEGEALERTLRDED